MGQSSDSAVAMRVAAQRYWCAGDAFRTRFYETMSLLAPEAERFFIGSIRDQLQTIADPVLVERCRDFIREEGEHSQVHRRLNQRLASSVPPERLIAPVRRLVDWTRAHYSPRFNLALTAAGEHLSAIMSELFLSGDRASEIDDPEIREIYVWHAREEMGHRAVAYDLLAAAGVSYRQRVLSMLLITLATPMLVAGILTTLLRRDAAAGRLRSWWQGLRWLSGRASPGPGLRHFLRNYLRYFRRDFHPEQIPAPA